MNNLTNNTSELRDILAAVNALPEAGSGSGENLDAEITEQAEKIDQLLTILDGKAAGGSELKTCTIKIVNECVSQGAYIWDTIYNHVVNDVVDVVFTDYSLHDTSPEIILDNVLCGSYVSIMWGGYSFVYPDLSNNCARLLDSDSSSQFKAPTEAGAVGIITIEDDS